MEQSSLRRLAQSESWAIWQKWLMACLANVQPPTPNQLRADEIPVERQAISKPSLKSGRVVRVPIVGAISRRASFWSMFFGGTSVDGISKALREIAADDTIGTVVLDIDSPGGTVAGIAELANEVRQLRDSKHVIALANNLMASAAYWIGSQADEIIATPDALVGSVGVFMMHEDWSSALEMAGLKVTYIQAGRYKTEGNPDEPLSDEARDHLQGIVNDAYALFVGDVAKGRGISASEVKAKYGEGRVLTAKDAKAVGMIDRVAGVEETMRRLTGVKAEEETPTIEEPSPTLPSPASTQGDGQTVGNSLAAKRLRLDLLEKSN